MCCRRRSSGCHPPPRLGHRCSTPCPAHAILNAARNMALKRAGLHSSLPLPASPWITELCLGDESSSEGSFQWCRPRCDLPRPPRHLCTCMAHFINAKTVESGLFMHRVKDKMGVKMSLGKQWWRTSAEWASSHNAFMPGLCCSLRAGISTHTARLRRNWQDWACCGSSAGCE